MITVAQIKELSEQGKQQVSVSLDEYKSLLDETKEANFKPNTGIEITNFNPRPAPGQIVGRVYGVDVVLSMAEKMH